MRALPILTIALCACAPSPAESLPPAPGVPGDAPALGGPRLASTTLSVTPLVPGDALTLTVTGAAAFEQVHIARSTAGTGAGPCLGSLGVLCLDLANPVTLHGSVVADAGGVAVLDQTLPETVSIGGEVTFQAIIPRGVSGLSWVKTNTVTVPIEDAPLHAGLFDPGDLRITEVMPQPDAVADAVGEWVEVHNVSGLDANLDGLLIADGLSTYRISGTTFLGDGERLVIGAEADPAVNGGVEIDREWTGLDLADQFGELALLDGVVVVDVVGWDDGSAFPLEPGRSLTLGAELDHLDNDLGSSWCAGDTVYGTGDQGTPGAPNDSCDPLVLSLEDDGHAVITTTEVPSQLGWAVAPLGDLDGDGFDELAVSDSLFNPDPLVVDAGGIWIVHGPIVGSFDVADAAGPLYGDDTNDNAGSSVAGVGDVDGDGTGDLLIGAPHAGAEIDPEGIAYLVTDPVVGAESLTDAAHARLLGEAGDDETGASVDGAGDLNGDGFADLIVGAPGNDSNGIDAGVAYVVYGPIVGDVDLSSADARLFGSTDFEEAGARVAGVGDLNGDGVPDLAVGAPDESTHAEDAGAVYIVHGPVSGDHELGTVATAILRGNVRNGGTRLTVAGVGDIDADGHDDLLIGATNLDAAYLFYGPITGELLFEDADAVLSYPLDASSNVGTSIDGPGDLNGDGFDDLLVAAPDVTVGAAFRGGTSFVVYGPVLGDIDLADADVILEGSNINGTSGSTLSGAGDMDGDGLLDLVVTDSDGPFTAFVHLVLGSQL